MMNPNDEKLSESTFGQQEVGSSVPRPESIMAAEESELDSPAGRVSPSGDAWAEGRGRLTQARDRTQLFLRENPVPAILGALTLGLAIGWALRHATGDDEKEVEVKSPMGNLDWSFLSLPFVWPFFRSVKDRYESSAETVKDGVSKLKNIDIRPYTKPIRKRWKAWRD
ncbi:MAG: hypothetical protein ACJ8M1_02930 [Chthoniobacterales bacterium]